MRDLHNSFHQGSGCSFQELIEGVAEAEGGWASYKNAIGLTARAGGYRSKYWAWLQENHANKWKSWAHYDKCKIIAHGLQKLDAQEAFNDMLSTSCDFLSTSSDSETLISVLYEILSPVFTNFSSFYNNDVLTVLVVELSKFCVPSNSLGIF